MREIREKSADAQAKPYFLKAAKEGVPLSWNHYEKMLPQDAFSGLGLVCYECLLGPCRINPFGKQNEKTVCGFGREELAVKTFSRLTGIQVTAQNVVADAFLTGALPALKNMYAQQPEAAACTKQIGLGLLKQENVNICLERVTVPFLEKVSDLAKKNAAMAEKVSAKGFGIFLAGASSSVSVQNIVCDTGSGELAVMTGLVDAYACGLPSRARNAANAYHTVFYLQENGECDENKILNLLSDACNAFAARDRSKILPSNTQTEARFSSVADLVAALQNKTYKGVCLLGGSSNVKLSQDDAYCRTVRAMTAAGILCVAFGNAAVILGKNSLLNGQAGVLGLWGGNALIEILNLLPYKGTPCYTYFPELCGKEDILGLLACAGKGIPAFTSTRLPVEGAQELSKALGQRISYGKPKEAPNAILSMLNGG